MDTVQDKYSWTLGKIAKAHYNQWLGTVKKRAELHSEFCRIGHRKRKNDTEWKGGYRGLGDGEWRKVDKLAISKMSKFWRANEKCSNYS